MYNNWRSNGVRQCICPKCGLDINKKYYIGNAGEMVYCPNCGTKNIDDSVSNGEMFKFVFGFDISTIDSQINNWTNEPFKNPEVLRDLSAYYDIK